MWAEFKFPPINLWNVWPAPNKGHYKGFTNYKCEYYPCHENVEEFNCLFCYCPLAWLECPGIYEIIETNDIKRKDCIACKIPHNGYMASWDIIQGYLHSPKVWSEE